MCLNVVPVIKNHNSSFKTNTWAVFEFNKKTKKGQNLFLALVPGFLNFEYKNTSKSCGVILQAHKKVLKAKDMF